MNYSSITIHKPTGLYRVVIRGKHLGLWSTREAVMEVIRTHGGYHGKLF